MHHRLNGSERRSIARLGQTHVPLSANHSMSAEPSSGTQPWGGTEPSSGAEPWGGTQSWGGTQPSSGTAPSDGTKHSDTERPDAAHPDFPRCHGAPSIKRRVTRCASG
jgi:hypothetical protein